MTPRQIAARAWADRDTTPPLDTILDALGLDDIPTVRTHGVDVVARWTEALNAWRALVARKGTDAAIPDKGHRQRTGRITFRCANPRCDFTAEWPPSKARKQKHCSQGCANRTRPERPAGAEMIERNLAIVRECAREDGPTQEEVGKRYGLTQGGVQNVLMRYRNGTGWARYLDESEAA